MKSSKVVHVEERTARLTILIDPRKKAVFERLCGRGVTKRRTSRP